MIEFVKIIKSSILIALVLNKLNNAVEIKTNKNISIDFVSVKFDIISLKLWKRMKNKFNNLIKSMNQILDYIDYK